MATLALTTPVVFGSRGEHDSKMRSLLVPFCALLTAAQLSGRAEADTELKNDSFENGQQAAFQAGFQANEIGAARFVAPAGRQLLAVRLLFGPEAPNRTITLLVWDDTAGTAAPGNVLLDADFDLMGSSSAFHDLDVSSMSVVLPAQFRVGIKFNGPPFGVSLGAPAIAADTNGNVANRNFIYYDGTIWGPSSVGGVQGDWIIRAIVSDGGGGTPDAGVPDASGGGPDASTGGPDAGSGNACTGNGDCEIGEYCDPDTRGCTFDCRHDSDCPGDGECNSLGQCVGADGGGGGCCETSGGGAGGALGAIGLAGLVGLVVTRRRRGAGSPRA